MRILLTNDDGILAEGLDCLRRIAAQLSDDVWVCAPETEQSGKSRGITLTDPLRVRRLGEKDFAVSGTPTDCVLLALNELVEGPRPDLVLSGVNRGHNVGEEVSMSGTVAGAVMAMSMGVPGIALSQSLSRYHDAVVARWDTAEAHGPALISRLVEQGWPDDVVINVNFPNRAPEATDTVEVTAQGFRSLIEAHPEKRTDLRGRDYYWMGFKKSAQEMEAGTDLHALSEGRISVTPLHIDMTHRETMHTLKGVLGGAVPKRVVHSG